MIIILNTINYQALLFSIQGSEGEFFGRKGWKPAMLHHISFAVADLDRSAAFYDAALATLGYVRVWADSTAVGYGLPNDGDKFAIKLRPERPTPAGSGFHLAFAASSREAVARFHAVALEHGGQDNGIPELCPEYGEHYYAAFVIDPDGYPIEAVINEPV